MPKKILLIFFFIHLFFLLNTGAQVSAECTLVSDSGWRCSPPGSTITCGCSNPSGQTVTCYKDEVGGSCGNGGLEQRSQEYSCSIGDSPCGGGGASCDEGINVPVWLRIYSVENGQTISWKGASDPILGSEWSVSAASGGGLDASGNFKLYKPAYYDFFSNSMQNWTWSLATNKISSNMNIDLRTSTAVHGELIKTGKNWSTHFCSGGIARNYDLTPKTVNSNGECGGPKTWTCQDVNNSCSSEDGNWYRYCRADFDGCFDHPFRLGVKPENGHNEVTSHGVYLKNMLDDARAEVATGVTDFAGRWALSYAVRDNCSSMTTKFTLTPPMGYTCKSVNVKGHSQLPTSVSQSLTDNTVFIKNADSTCTVEFNPKSGGNLVLLELEPRPSPPTGIISAPSASSNINVSPDAKVCLGDNISLSFSGNHSQSIYSAHFYSKPVNEGSWRSLFDLNSINTTSYSKNLTVNADATNFAKNKDYYFTTGFKIRAGNLDAFAQCSGNPEYNFVGSTGFSYCGNSSFSSNPLADNSQNRPWRKIHVVDDADTPVITDISPNNLVTKLKIEYTSSNKDTLGLILYRKLATAPDSDYYVVDSFDSGITYSLYLKYYPSGTMYSPDGLVSYTCTGSEPNVKCTVEYTDVNATCNGTLFTYRAKLVVGYPLQSNTYYQCPYAAFSNALTNISCAVANQNPILSIAGYKYSLSGPLIPLTPGYLVSPYQGAVLHYTVTDAENDATTLAPSVNFGNLYDNNNAGFLTPSQPSVVVNPPTLFKYRWMPVITFSSTVGDVGWKVNGVNLTADPNANFLLTASGMVYAPQNAPKVVPTPTSTPTPIPTPVSTVTPIAPKPTKNPTTGPGPVVLGTSSVLAANDIGISASYSATIKLREPTGTIQFQPVKDMGTVVSNDYTSNCTNSSTFDNLPVISGDDYKKPNITFSYNSYTPSQVSNLSLTSSLSQKVITALPDANTKYTATITLPSNSANQYEVRCLYVYMATNDPSAGTLVYSGSRVNNFSIPMEYNRTYSVKVVVGKSNSANSWIQGVGSSLNARNYFANYENFPSGEFLLKDGVNTKAGVFFTKYDITGTNFSAPSSFASNNKYLAINKTNTLNVSDISTRGYLSKSNFFEDYKLNYANCTSGNNVSGTKQGDECFKPSSGDTIIVDGLLTPGNNSRNFYFDSSVVKISSNIKKPGASQNKSLPLFVVKGDLIIDSTVTSLEGIFLVGGSVVFNTGGTNQTDAPIVIEGSIIAKKDIIVYRDGLYNLDAQNNTLPIVRVDYLPRFLLDANFNYLREYSVSIFNND